MVNAQVIDVFSSTIAELLDGSLANQHTSPARGLVQPQFVDSEVILSRS